jgi:hypothetical protein
VYKLGIACGAALSLIPLLLIRYPDSLKAQVEADLAERRSLTEENKRSIAEV